jgi:hypothetical protein
MKFPYQRYAVEASPVFSRGLVYRPEITLRLIGGAGDATIHALVDTGADGTLFPQSIGEAIGATIYETNTAIVRGLGGELLTVVAGEVEIEVADGDEYHRWKMNVGFTALDDPHDEVAILRHAGFLDYLRTTFDGQARELQLTRLIPSVPIPRKR